MADCNAHSFEEGVDIALADIPVLNLMKQQLSHYPGHSTPGLVINEHLVKVDVGHAMSNQNKTIHNILAILCIRMEKPTEGCLELFPCDKFQKDT